MAVTATVFDPIKYKETTRQQWQEAAEAWYRWGPMIGEWLGPATELMLDMAGITTGKRVLDVVAGAGEQAIRIARRVGPTGNVLATDIAPNLLVYADKVAQEAGFSNVETSVMDGESLELPEAAFDAVLSRIGLIYFPDQQKALIGMHHVLKDGGKKAAMVYSTPEKNQFFSIPVSIIRRRAQLPPPLLGQPGPFSLGSPGLLDEAYRKAGFQDIQTRLVSAPLRLPSAAECVRFVRESFVALHQMMAGLPEAERQSTWEEIEQDLRKFEGTDGFVGPCELVLVVGTRRDYPQHGI
jgi:ubiquinone/menaquinone biosynthesis C-methylase UbiE